MIVLLGAGPYPAIQIVGNVLTCKCAITTPRKARLRLRHSFFINVFHKPDFLKQGCIQIR